MGSTYLDLTNRVLRRLNEVELADAEFAGVRGIHAAAKDAVQDIVREINAQKMEWPFNSATGTQLLTIGTNEYTWPADFRIADWDSFYIQKDGTIGNSTQQLQAVSKEFWFNNLRERDLDAATTGVNLPLFVFQSSTTGYGVTPSPIAAYTVKYKYFINTIDLDASTDVCTIPSEYDHVIMYGALTHLYMFLDNDERTSKIEQNFTKALNNMSYILIPRTPAVYDSRMPTIINNGMGW